MSIMSKLTKTKVQIKVSETTKLSQILFWNCVVTYIVTLFLCYFLRTSHYINIGWIVCGAAYLLYLLSIWKRSGVVGTSPLDFNQTLDAINKSIENKI